MYAATLYQDQSVSTANPRQLVTLLYDRVLVALARCQTSAGIETVNDELQRAQDIISELRATLDHDRGGDLARNLAALYDFCLDRLLAANLKKDFDLAAPVERIVGELREAWVEACAAVEQ